MPSAAVSIAYRAQSVAPAVILCKPPSRTEPVLVPIDLLRPTQVAVGMRAVEAKREKVERKASKARKIQRFLEKRPIPAVLGPGSGFYILDHHHLSLALWHCGVDEAFVRVVGDLSAFSPGRFWSRMAETGSLYPFDETGRRVPHTELPRVLPELRSDPYRDLAWAVRREGGFEKSHEHYAEFRWADFFRSRIGIGEVRKRYDHALEAALRLARSRDARRLPGYIGRH